MTYKQLKWFILLIPTITVGLWEYVRHEYLLSYISMDVGNWLTPVIVLFVTFTLLTRFFRKLEHMQEQLRMERAEKAVLEERERIARDLHDGMAQSLFLLSIKVKQLEKLQVREEDRPKLDALNENIVSIHEYVRTGIENLRNPPKEDVSFTALLDTHIETFERETKLKVKKKIDINPTCISKKEKIEMIACIGEAFVNIQKHAQASKVMIDAKMTPAQRYLIIKDNGVGFDYEAILQNNHYGLKIMEERCRRIGWCLQIKRDNGWTVLSFTPREQVK